MKRAALFVLALSTTSLAVAGCDDQQDEEAVVEQQLADTDLQLEEALELVTEASEDGVVVDGSFEAGVEDGFYEVIAIEGDEEVTYEVDGRTRRRVAHQRRRANAERARLAREHRHLRRRIAAAIREHRAERPDERPVRVRLLDREIEIEVLRRGQRHRVRRRLAD